MGLAWAHPVCAMRLQMICENCLRREADLLLYGYNHQHALFGGHLVCGAQKLYADGKGCFAGFNRGYH